MDVRSASIDADEIKRFGKMSAIWWDANGAIKTMHTANRIRVPRVCQALLESGIAKKDYCNRPLEGLRILDVGCGGGLQSEALARLGCSVMGLDPSHELIEVAKEHAALDANLADLTYRLESVESHARGNADTYDAVVASEVLYHVADKDVFLENCVKCLKPGGMLFLSSSNRTWLAWLLTVCYYEWLTKRVAPGTFNWYKFPTPQETQAALAKHRCKVLAIRGYFYNFLNNTWYWCWSTKAKFAMEAIKC